MGICKEYHKLGLVMESIGFIYRLLNYRVPSLPWRNFSIPPNRPASLFEDFYERSDAFAVCVGIAEKDVGHILLDG
jgi:hypothetical protein